MPAADTVAAMRSPRRHTRAEPLPADAPPQQPKPAVPVQSTPWFGGLFGGTSATVQQPAVQQPAPSRSTCEQSTQVDFHDLDESYPFGEQLDEADWMGINGINEVLGVRLSNPRTADNGL